MKMRKLLLILVIIYPIIISAQETQLYETVNYQNAVKNGTRSRDGKPGLNYWQNHADYDISVKLDTTEKKIFGKERVIYYNESPDTLKRVVLRLYKNRFKAGAVRNREVNEKNIHDGMLIDKLIINDSIISFSNSHIVYNGTNMGVYLDKPLAPNSSIELYCEWNYKIALEPELRAGYYKDNAWFIGYFYPQIAVYDDIEQFDSWKGWDYKLFHKGWLEFYNDFNNYKVQIEVPENFFVWATGDLKNSDKVYSKPIIQKLERAKTTNEIVKIISKEDLNKNLLIGNSWVFEATNVMDFAFGTASNYLWDGSSVQLNDKRVFVDVAYNPASELYPGIINVARNSVIYASKDFPGVQFPYSHATTFNGLLRSGGMEYPMIANVGNFNDSALLYIVLSHEIFHNYLPFMMGINEKRYLFVDEGFAFLVTDAFLKDYYEIDYYSKIMGNSEVNGLFNGYEYYMMNNEDHSSLYNSFAQIDVFNFRFQYCVKPVLPLKLFIDMVGEDRFLFAFKEFVNRWQGKHPTPHDLFYTINDVLEENYNWYWQPWYFEIGYCDLGIELQEKVVSVRNVGGYPLPIELIVEYTDGTSKSITKSMDVWKKGEKQILIKVENFEKVKSICLDDKSVPDINHSNNYIEIN